MAIHASSHSNQVENPTGYSIDSRDQTSLTSWIRKIPESRKRVGGTLLFVRFFPSVEFDWLVGRHLQIAYSPWTFLALGISECCGRARTRREKEESESINQGAPLSLAYLR